ncbi:MAG: putative GTP-binding protein YjiA [Methanomassiliicoccales archaeon PtaU1.Bin124]|nr:MAG: putative GTP-binding protein YjiA [Methanomassiliicoccales archaeon PtaU1.Bin124]
MTTRIAIIGGFLGAGKTTIINKLAKSLKEKGNNVAIITNDQGEALVDTKYCADNGIEVAEVLRGCFCCKFPDFMHSARGLVGSKGPEVILAEPVGSCTDLLATVVAPLKVMYPKEFTVAPLVILVDSERVLEQGFDPEKIGDYLRKHQIMEAEHVVLSKTDKVTAEELDEIKEVITTLNPHAHIISYSAITNKGLDKILAIILSNDVSARTPVDIDYDIYAKAEAELGWYNGTFRFHAKDKVDGYDIATKVLRSIAAQYGADDIAHAKIMLQSERSSMKISSVMQNITVDNVSGSRYADGNVTLTVNARIVSSPEMLRQTVRMAVQKTMEQANIAMSGFEDDCFSPSRPNPTHRMK